MKMNGIVSDSNNILSANPACKASGSRLPSSVSTAAAVSNVPSPVPQCVERLEAQVMTLSAPTALQKVIETDTGLAAWITKCRTEKAQTAETSVKEIQRESQNCEETEQKAAVT